MDPLRQIQSKLITANHILDHHGVVDAYGHISVRHPFNPAVYIMCGYMAPALVCSPADLVEYHVSDSSTVDPDAKKGYSERFIHGELYRMYADVHCVIHSHAEDVLPFVVSGVPMRAVYHMSGFLVFKSNVLLNSITGSSVPVFDIDPLYTTTDQRDMLVNNAKFGTALAAYFSSGPSSSRTQQHQQQSEASNPKPTRSVVLMRRHGFTAIAHSIETAVYRAIYTKINAAAQTKAMALLDYHHDIVGDSSTDATTLVFLPGADGAEGMALTEDQCVGCGKMNEGFQDKPWKLWVREVEGRGIYVNRMN